MRLIPPQYVKPYVKTNKNDATDAEAICEALTRPTMRFTALKERRTTIRSDVARPSPRAVGSATHDADQCVAGALCRIRHHRCARPVPVLEELIKLIEEDAADSRLPDLPARQVLQVFDLPDPIDPGEIASIEKKLTGLAHLLRSKPATWLRSPGSGLITATAVVASVGNASRTPARHASLRPGSVSFRNSDRVAARSGSGISPSAATATSGGCWCTARAPHLQLVEAEEADPFGLAHPNFSCAGRPTWCCSRWPTRRRAHPPGPC